MEDLDLCGCGARMKVKANGDSVYLRCFSCGQHRSIHHSRLKGKSPNDTQPIEPMKKPEGMTLAQIAQSQERISS